MTLDAQPAAEPKTGRGAMNEHRAKKSVFENSSDPLTKRIELRDGGSPGHGSEP